MAPSRCSSASGEHRNIDVGAHLEAQLLVESNCRVVGLPCVQKCAITAGDDVRNNYCGQSAGESTPPEVRVSADTTQLGVAGSPHSLPRHGSELTVNAYADEATHAICPLQERT